MAEQATKVLTGRAAMEATMRGIRAIYEPVRLTLGPEGGNALLNRTFNRGNRITNDGVSIAKMIEPLDEFEQQAAHAFREACDQTNQKVGDGTTTTTVVGGKLALDTFGTILENAGIIRTKSAGGKIGVMKLKRDIQAAAKLVTDEIKKRAKKVETLEELEKIAVVSVEDEAIGKIVAKMTWDVGIEGFIDVTDGVKGEIETEIIRGMRLPAKIPAKAFVNNPQRFEMVVQDIPCVVTNHALTNAADVAAFTSQLNTAKLVIFAPSFSENVLVGLVQAFKQGAFIHPVAVPSLRTEQFEDLAVYLGASFINKDIGRKIQGVRESDLGFAEKIVVKDTDAKEDATIIGGRGDKEQKVKVGEIEGKVLSAVAERVKVLKGQIIETKVELHKKLLERRIASISAAVGVIRVGSASQAESLYLKLKIEDAVYAAKAALQEGYVKGGGLCLKEIAEHLPKSVLTNALLAPYEQIQANAEGSLEVTEDIIDPAKVVRLCVEHAVSVVAQLITVKINVVEIRQKDPAEGYEAIARAIDRYVKLQYKHLGLIQENQEEMDKDNMARYESNVLEHGNG